MPWADLTDVRCYYEILGRGDPILFISGLGATCDIWRPAAPLADDFSLIFTDNRGIGQSISKRPAVSLSSFTSDLLELLDFLQLERAHVIGMSLGGIVAQRFAIDHPSRVDRLVLISSAHRNTPYLQGVSSLLAIALRKMPWEFFVRTVEVLGTAPEFVDANPQEVARRIDEKADCRGCREAVARQLQCLADDGVETKVARIAAPTLVLAGEHDALIPAVYARQMAAEIPNAQFELIEQTGHNPLSERPAEVIEHIARFLRKRHRTARELHPLAEGRARQMT